MTIGDYFSAAILLLFVILGLAGCMKWVLRGLLGAAIGAGVLVALGSAAAVPGLGRASDVLNEGQLTPGLTRQADRAMVALGMSPQAAPRVEMTDRPIFLVDPSELQTAQPAGNPLEGPDAWQIHAEPAPATQR
jgi:hypothetical protein